MGLYRILIYRQKIVFSKFADDIGEYLTIFEIQKLVMQLGMYYKLKESTPGTSEQTHLFELVMYYKLMVSTPYPCITNYYTGVFYFHLTIFKSIITHFNQKKYENMTLRIINLAHIKRTNHRISNLCPVAHRA